MRQVSQQGDSVSHDSEVIAVACWACLSES